jgi:outer membrane protein OmpA-like peptidoglycan-associated protein
LERFGLSINRVDSVLLGVGGEFMSEFVRPFAEWTMDISSNRQSYRCVSNRAAPGDSCLAFANALDGAPSRLTLGARVTPPINGLSAMLAFDIGTSGTSRFISERAPEIPWNFFVGIGYAVDTYTAPPQKPVPPAAKIITVAPSTQYRIIGKVVDETSSQPVAHAVVTFEGQTLTGMVTAADGAFESGAVSPGEYALSVAADGYKAATCKVTVSPKGTPQPPSSEQPAVEKSEVQCFVKAAPSLASLDGQTVDAESGLPIAGCHVIVIDERKRSIEMNTEAAGTFSAQNVPAGRTRIRVAANEFLPNVTEIVLKKNTEFHATLMLHKAPKKPNITVAAKELKLKLPLMFGDAPSNSNGQNDAVMQELAATLLQHSELLKIEIQSFTDDSGNPSEDKRLGEERAAAVRSRLVELGVEENRLSIAAHGNESPLAPNTTPANHAKNRTIRFMILQKL